MMIDKLLGRQKDEEYVRHITLGVGIVEHKGSMGFRLLVHYPDGIVRKSRSDEVTYISREEYDRSVAGTGSGTASDDSVDGRPYEGTKDTAIGMPGGTTSSATVEKRARGRSGSKNRELPEARDGSHVQTRTVGPHDPMNDHPAKERALPNITERDYRRSNKEFQARQVIESLRLGIPPQGVAEDFFEVFTVGREDEMERIKGFLEDEGEGSIIITGEYGSGKTHMMELTASIAIREGWAVSMVELDTTEAPMSRPKSVYEKIVRSMRYMKDGRVQDLRNMLDDAASSENYENIMDHEYLGRIIRSIRDKEVTESHYVWIEGSGNRKYPFIDVLDQGSVKSYEDRDFPPMHHEMTSANIYCNILNGIGYMATELLHLKGLLILFDEAESVDRGYYTKHAADMGINFIRGLSSVCSNDPVLFKESEDLDKNVDPEGIGKRTGLRYSRQNPIGFVYAVPSCVKTIYCLTPVEDILCMDPFSKMGRIDLAPIGNGHSKEIFENLGQYYALAYDFDTNGRVSGDESIVSGAFNGGLRMGIKGAVEIFDRVRLRDDPSTA